MTKLWYASVGLVSSKITNWLSGNWLLPSLPAPQPLESSVDRFVESMKLCLSEPRAAALKIMAERFKKTVGPSLHSKVGTDIRFDPTTHSYLEDARVQSE